MGGCELSTKYCCPNCKTNRSRFNIVNQVAHAVKIDAQTGDIIEQYTGHEDAGPLHLIYNGPDVRIQCAVCGLIEDENRFIKFAER